jgi:AAA family ATPase
MKELKSLGLSTGDLMRLSTTDGPKGLAIAWLANQTNPGNKPIAKVTDLLREVYGLTLNDRVFIEKAKVEATPFQHVEVSLDGRRDSNESTEELVAWVRYALGRNLANP